METGKVLGVIMILILILAGLIFLYGFRDSIAEGLGGLELPRLEIGKRSTGGNRTDPLNQGGIGGGTVGSGNQKTVVESISPYYGRVRLSARPVSGRVSPLTNPGLITLSVSLSPGERINLTGWTIQANRGALIVPRAAGDFRPISGGSESDIILGSGSHTLNLYTSTSAVGKNFRMNKCMGYLERIYDFKPRLSASCPSISRTEYEHLPGSCQNYINRFNGSCRDPLADPESNYLSNECKEQLKKLNYGACYERHYQDKDFFSSKWMIWTGVNILDSQHDVVQLLDREGRLVNEYKY